MKEEEEEGKRGGRKRRREGDVNRVWVDEDVTSLPFFSSFCSFSYH